ncbi:MAG: hypothetical protein RLZ83_1480, partial [Pseudomonadota bacterium]
MPGRWGLTRSLEPTEVRIDKRSSRSFRGGPKDSAPGTACIEFTAVPEHGIVGERGRLDDVCVQVDIQFSKPLRRVGRPGPASHKDKGLVTARGTQGRDEIASPSGEPGMPHPDRRDVEPGGADALRVDHWIGADGQHDVPACVSEELSRQGHPEAMEIAFARDQQDSAVADAGYALGLEGRGIS